MLVAVLLLLMVVACLLLRANIVTTSHKLCGFSTMLDVCTLARERWRCRTARMFDDGGREWQC